MPRKRKTLDEQIGLLSGKKKDINKRLETLRVRQNRELRKLDTREKIVGGALLFSEASADPDFARDLCARFERRIAPKDRPLLAKKMEGWKKSGRSLGL